MAEWEQISKCFDDVLRFFVLILDRSSFQEKHVLENSRRVDHVSIDYRRYCQANHRPSPHNRESTPHLTSSLLAMAWRKSSQRTRRIIPSTNNTTIIKNFSLIFQFFFVYFSPLPVCCLFSISHPHNTIHQASPDRMEWNFFSKSCILAVKSRRRRCRRFHWTFRCYFTSFWLLQHILTGFCDTRIRVLDSFGAVCYAWLQCRQVDRTRISLDQVSLWERDWEVRKRSIDSTRASKTLLRCFLEISVSGGTVKVNVTGVGTRN